MEDMAGIKRKAKAAFVFIFFTFMFALLEKTGMIAGKKGNLKGRLGVDGKGCSPRGRRNVN